jgi:hypothetical protein
MGASLVKVLSSDNETKTDLSISHKPEDSFCQLGLFSLGNFILSALTILHRAVSFVTK